MALPVELDLNHWIKVAPAEGKTQTVKSLGGACYYSAEPRAPEIESPGKPAAGTELTENSTKVVEAPGLWFIQKIATTGSAQKPVVLEVQEANTETIGTSQLAKEAVTAPKLGVVGGVGAGVWGSGERAPRTSASWPGAGVPVEQAVQAAEVGNFVAVPVVPGDVIKTVAVAGGAKTPVGIAEYITAIYEGKTGGALLAQSKSATPGAHPKEELYTATLESAVTITASNAPKGYVYVMFSAGVMTTPFEVIALTYTTANQAKLGLYGTAGIAANAIYNSGGTSIKTKAEATVPTLTAVAGVPIVALY